MSGQLKTKLASIGAGRVSARLESKIIGGGLTSMGVRMTGVGLGFISQVLLSRMLGASDFGTYSVLISWSLLIVVPVKFGLDLTTLKFAAGYWAEQNFRSVNALAVSGAKALCITIPLAGLGIFAVNFVVPGLFGSANLPDLALMALMFGILGMIGILSQFFRAAQMIFYSQFFEQVLRSVFLIGLLLGIAYLGLPFTTTDALAMAASAAGLALAAMLLTFFLKIWASGAGMSVDAGERAQWLRVSWPLFGAAIAGQALNQMSVIVLGAMAPDTAAGQFAAAVRLAAFVTFALAALNSITAPMIAAAFKRDDKDELNKIATINARIASIAGLGICGVFAVFGKMVLGLFGPEFPAAYPALLVLLVGTFCGAATGPVGFFLSMTNQQRFFLWSSIGCVLFTLGVTVWAVSAYGLLGAAIGAATGQVALNLSRWYVVRKRLGIDASFVGLPTRVVATQS